MPHHSDPVRTGEDLAELMGNQNNAQSVGPQFRYGPEQSFAFLGRQYRGGLIEYQHAGTCQKLLQDFHLLLIPDRELPDRHPWVDRKTETVGVEAHTLEYRSAPKHRRKISL